MLTSAPSPAGNSVLQQENVVCYPETKLKKNNINQGRILSNDSWLLMIPKIVLVLQWGFLRKTADFLAKIICSEQTQDPRHCGFKIYIIDLYKDLKRSTRLIWIWQLNFGVDAFCVCSVFHHWTKLLAALSGHRRRWLFVYIFLSFGVTLMHKLCRGTCLSSSFNKSYSQENS